MPQRNLRLARKLNYLAVAVSAIVFLMVVVMRRVTLHTDMDLSFLPGTNAILNTVASILIILGWISIKRKNVHRHRLFMVSAMVVSIIFLVSYVIYHITTEETLFCHEGWIRGVYFLLLILHIVLAAVILPFILFTFIRAFTAQFGRHKKLAKWVFPLWLFVTISGPVLYLLLRDCYS